MDTTEITLATGDRYQIMGSLEDVEAVIISASRGSILQFAWFSDPDGGRFGVNPGSVVSLRSGETE